MGFVITDLSHQRTHTLPLYWLGVIVKRSEGEDKVENDTKQKKKKEDWNKKWVQDLSRESENRKWIQSQNKPNKPKELTESNLKYVRRGTIQVDQTTMRRRHHYTMIGQLAEVAWCHVQHCMQIYLNGFFFSFIYLFWKA